MAIYEQFIGATRDDFASYDDLKRRYKITYPQNFNFAYDVLDVIAQRAPNKHAMVWVGADGAEKFITFGDMAKLSNKAANYFTSLGIGKGDFVLLVLKRSDLFWYCMMGLCKIGAIVVQATHLLTAKDYMYRCDAADIKMAVVTGDNDCTRHFDEGEPYKTVKIKAVTKHKDAKGWLDFEEGFYKASDQWSRSMAEDMLATDTMLVSFSSGTTGYPKMVRHDFTYPLGHIMTAVFWQRVEDGGLHFTISDTGWLKSLWGKLYGQWLGESAVFVYDFDRFATLDILAKIQQYKITTFCAPPTMLRMMVAENMREFDLSSLAHCCTAGEALNPDTYNKWLNYTGKKIYEGFGQTESTVMIGTLYPFMQPRASSMGRPIPGYDLFVADDDGRQRPSGVTGEIVARASRDIIRNGADSRLLDKAARPVGLFCDYYKNERSTQNAFSNGLYHSGDTAYADESGYIYYVGRNDDIIKSSGYRIGPFEVESVLAEHPAVLEVAVTGVADPIRGYSVKATIVPARGYEPSPELVKELQTYVKTHTAPYKYPRIVEFVTELPKTISGKIQRVLIRAKDAEK
ncbi:MAG: AMP-binding protein [Clostridiales bacterium]|jgi:acetyl-CoA synthetase|nr:AMP-binding protein [Clostridiales bacterium]